MTSQLAEQAVETRARYKRCNTCCRWWSHQHFMKLPYIGVMVGVELRRCACNSSLSFEDAVERTECPVECSVCGSEDTCGCDDY